MVVHTMFGHVSYTRNGHWRRNPGQLLGWLVRGEVAAMKSPNSFISQELSLCVVAGKGYNTGDGWDTLRLIESDTPAGRARKHSETGQPDRQQEVQQAAVRTERDGDGGRFAAGLPPSFRSDVVAGGCAVLLQRGHSDAED
jgi:hypothetical protein